MCIPQDCDDRSKEAKRNIPFGWGRFFFLIHSLSTLIPQRPAPRGRFPFLLFLRHHRTRQLHHKIVIKRTREFRDSFNRLIVEGFHKLMRPPPSRLKSREKPAEPHWAASEKKGSAACFNCYVCIYYCFIDFPSDATDARARQQQRKWTTQRNKRMNFYPKSKLWNRAPWHSVRRRAAIWLSQGANCRHFRAANRFMKTARFSQPITTRAAPRHPQSAAEDKIPQNLWASFEYFFACCFYSRMPSGDARWRVSRACESNVQFSTSRMNKKKSFVFRQWKSFAIEKCVFFFVGSPEQHRNNVSCSVYWMCSRRDRGAEWMEMDFRRAA